MLLTLLSSGQGTLTTDVDAQGVIDRLLPSLGVYKTADLTHWTEAELFEWADEATKRFACKVGSFVVRDTSNAIADDTPQYALPARHVATVHVSLGTAALTVTNREELEALDETWTATEDDNPDKWFVEDEENLRVYPEPTALSTGSLGLITYQYPVEITSAAATVTAPKPLEGYLGWVILAEARRKESDAAMPEVSRVLDSLIQLFEGAAKTYWGVAL